MRAALSVNGRIVVGHNHVDCFMSLTETEKDEDMLSGFFDSHTSHFISDREGEVLAAKEIYLVRHGHYAACDDPDPDLDQEGEVQVHHTADFLGTHDLTHFTGITSPLLRCLKTAAILHQKLGIPFRIVPEVMETPDFLGEGEVFRMANRSRQFPQFDWPTAREWHILPETPWEFLERVKETLHLMPPKSIVVTHFGYICQTAKIALCKRLFSESYPPASVTFFEGQEGRRLGWTDEKVLQNRPTLVG
jgi:broad specificity phosphatase PhoE